MKSPTQSVSYQTFIEAIYSGLIAFGIYSCMYAFRKPFTVGIFEGYSCLGLGLKSCLIIAQLVGYTLSKFFGIRFISALPKMAKWKYILFFILCSWIPLFLFPFINPNFGILLFFLNGLPLGMIWGIVFSYLEGRKSTELSGALLCSSFIFSSGMVKSLGKWTMSSFSVNEFWMPSVVGGLTLIPLVLFLFLMEKISPPSLEDIQSRSERSPMTKYDRQNLWKSFGIGFTFLIVAYVGLTIIRDLRDNFVADIWIENGVLNNAAIFSETELPATLIVLAVMGTLIFIQDNKKAFNTLFLIISGGLGFALLSTALFYIKIIPVEIWITCLGIGLYMGYIPFNCILFERFFAVFKCKGNSGFLIYLADSFGYLGSMGVLLWKEFGNHAIRWTEFLTQVSFIVCITGLGLILLSWNYFKLKQKSNYHG